MHEIYKFSEIAKHSMFKMNNEYLNIDLSQYWGMDKGYNGELILFEFDKSTIWNFNSKIVFFTFDIVIQIIKCDGY